MTDSHSRAVGIGAARFVGKVVAISGTGGGQGRRAAHLFAAEGARVLGCDIDAERGRETLDLVLAAGGEMVSVEPLDLTEPAEAQRWIEAGLSRWGRIDVLYNNAAGLGFGTIDDDSLDRWDRTIRHELTIGYVATRTVWPHMRQRRAGVIVNVASIAAHLELSEFPDIAHGVANAGIQAMTRALAARGAEFGIRCVSISPGIVANRNLPGPFADPDSREMMALWDPTALGRPAEMDEIVRAAMFLASDDASYITGTDLAVDGGLSGIIWRRPPAA